MFLENEGIDTRSLGIISTNIKSSSAMGNAQSDDRLSITSNTESNKTFDTFSSQGIKPTTSSSLNQFIQDKSTGWIFENLFYASQMFSIPIGDAQQLQDLSDECRRTSFNQLASSLSPTANNLTQGVPPPPTLLTPVKVITISIILHFLYDLATTEYPIRWSFRFDGRNTSNWGR